MRFLLSSIVVYQGRHSISYHGHAALPLSAVFDFAGCHACRENDLRGDNNEGDQLRKALHLW